MYVPDWFRIDDRELILETIRSHSFATFVGMVEGELFATHLPVVITQEEPLVLTGHVAAQNPQAACLDGEQVSMIVFQGFHTYVSPVDYETSPNVPTWNYVAVHAYGRAELVSEPSEVLGVLEVLVSTFDPHLQQIAPASTEPDFWATKLKGVAAFRMVVDRIEAKGKLSQNKPELDQVSVIRALENRGDAESIGVARAMKTVRGK